MQVFIRKRTVKNGNASLYLDYYHNGNRRTETLDLHLTGNKYADKQTMDLAESIRTQRMLEFKSLGKFRLVFFRFHYNTPKKNKKKLKKVTSRY